MRFSYATVFVGFAGAALAQSNSNSNVTSDFEPITKPANGDTAVAGDSYTIEWNYGAAYYPGHANLSLQQGDDFASLKTIGGIEGSIETDAAKYKWDLSDSIPSGDNYYIKMIYLKDKSIYNYSGKFAIRNNKSSGGNSTSTATGSSNSTATATATGDSTTSTDTGRGTATATSPSTISTYTTVTLSATGTGTTSAPSGTASSSTQTGGSYATAGPAPLAFIGAAAIGIWAL